MTQLDTAPAAATAKLGRKRDLTRDPEILDATLEVLAETGYDGMTIDMVAARAKAGKATVYRRWASKSELVIDAVACMKSADIDFDALPDTGTLRGDLIAMIKPHSIEDGAKKLQVMAGLVSMLSTASRAGRRGEAMPSSDRAPASTASSCSGPSIAARSRPTSTSTCSRRSAEPWRRTAR